jgi:hypothetical protein
VGDAEQLTGERAARVVDTVARRHGVSDPVRPLRASANHVFRAGDVIVRVAQSAADVNGQAFDHAALLTWEERCAAEAKARMRYWLGDVSRPVWTAL